MLDSVRRRPNTAARRRLGGATLRFGISGIPLSSPRPDTPSGIRRVRELGLECLEMAWVNGVRMGGEMAERIARAARESDVVLTAHAPYYINLCGERTIVSRSRRRLRETARLGVACGARSFCFHAGFYRSQAREEAAAGVREELHGLLEELKAEQLAIDVRPELTGKPTQVGSLEELLDWSETVPGVRPCIDFAHQHARTGAFNTYEEYCSVLEAVGARLGKSALCRMHLHISGVDYGPKGERRHLPLRESDLDYRALLRAMRDYGVEGWVVTESPLMEHDALFLQRAWRRL